MSHLNFLKNETVKPRDIQVREIVASDVRPRPNQGENARDVDGFRKVANNIGRKCQTTKGKVDLVQKATNGSIENRENDN